MHHLFIKSDAESETDSKRPVQSAARAGMCGLGAAHAHTAEPALCAVCADVAERNPSVCVFPAKPPGPLCPSSQLVSLLRGSAAVRQSVSHTLVRAQLQTVRVRVRGGGVEKNSAVEPPSVQKLYRHGLEEEDGRMQLLSLCLRGRLLWDPRKLLLPKTAAVTQIYQDETVQSIPWSRHCGISPSPRCC